MMARFTTDSDGVTEEVLDWNHRPASKLVLTTLSTGLDPAVDAFENVYGRETEDGGISLRGQQVPSGTWFEITVRPSEQPTGNITNLDEEEN